MFKGIKPPPETKTYTDFARYPLNDLSNFATVAAPSRHQEALMDSVYNYRERLGSTNVPKDLKDGYFVALKDTHIPFGMKRREDDITLGKSNRREGMRQFDQEFKAARPFMQPESRAMLTNLAQGKDMENLLKVVFPGGFGARGAAEGFQTHGQVLSRLNKEYQGDKESLAMIARADASARAHGVIPDQSSFISRIMGHTQEAHMEAVHEDE